MKGNQRNPDPKYKLPQGQTLDAAMETLCMRIQTERGQKGAPDLTDEEWVKMTFHFGWDFGFSFNEITKAQQDIGLLMRRPKADVI